MRKLAVITGVAGQDGAYLADFLIKKNYRVIGLATSLSPRHLHRLAHFDLLKKITLIKADIRNGKRMSRLIKKYQPREFYNLAGLSSVAASWQNPAETFKSNAVAVLNMLERIRKDSPKTRFFQASSAEIYGQINGIITEKTARFEPCHPYGIAKLAAHHTVKNYREHYGLFAVNGILFNHESPLRDNRFVTKIITKGVAAIVKGSKTKINLGNLSAERDFGFAGDVVDAMWRMLQMPTPRDLVVCSGKTFSVADVVKEALTYSGIKNWRGSVTVVSALKRKHEVRVMRGSSAALRAATGWKPKTSFKTLVRQMVDYELQKL